MIDALAADFAAIQHLQVSILRDARWSGRYAPAAADRGPLRCYPVRTPGEESEHFDRLAAQSDWAVVIAPELAGRLLDRCRRVVALGGRLLGPEPPLVEVASDKQRTAEHLAAAGVAVPVGITLQPGDSLPADFDYPAVLKPRWGAGSQGVRRIDRLPAEGGPSVEIACPSRLERYCPGLPASVAFLCGPAGRFALIPCRQRLSDDGRFEYLGGCLPLERCFGPAGGAAGAGRGRDAARTDRLPGDRPGVGPRPWRGGGRGDRDQPPADDLLRGPAGGRCGGRQPGRGDVGRPPWPPTPVVIPASWDTIRPRRAHTPPWAGQVGRIANPSRNRGRISNPSYGISPLTRI